MSQSECELEATNLSRQWQDRGVADREGEVGERERENKDII